MTEMAQDLLQESARTLREQLASQAKGEARYLALLTANAVDMAARELRMAAKPLPALPAIQDIRQGSLDDDTAAFAALCQHAAIQAWIADPANLDAAEQERYIHGDER